MDWSNERYVRLYSRDTTAWLMLPWQARALLPLLLRKLDRAGVMDLAPGYPPPEVIAFSVGLPADVVSIALPALLENGTLVIHGDRLVMPNYLPAQEAVMSNAQRQREARARRRETSITPVTKRYETVTDGHALSRAVTKRDSPNVPTLCDVTGRDGAVTGRDGAVTGRDETVTRCHALSRAVTPAFLADPAAAADTRLFSEEKPNQFPSECDRCHEPLDAGAGRRIGRRNATTVYVHRGQCPLPRGDALARETAIGSEALRRSREAEASALPPEEAKKRIAEVVGALADNATVPNDGDRTADVDVPF